MPGTKNSGARKTPTALLKVWDSEHARGRNEPPVVMTKVDPPEHLNKVAREVWEAHYEVLRSLGILSLTDTLMFAAFCETVADYLEVVEECAERPHYIPIKDKEGNTLSLREAPWCIRKRMLLPAVERLAREFGLTPSSRADMNVLAPFAGEEAEIIP